MDTEAEFRRAVDQVILVIGGMALDEKLEQRLQAEFPTNSDVFQALKKGCECGEGEGWALSREAAGIKYGRVISPAAETANFSVDIVRMSNIKGPAHTHPSGEIGAVIPISGAPVFDDKWDNWYVYEAGSSHSPTISDGDAYVIYFLPGGEIEFAR